MKPTVYTPGEIYEDPAIESDDPEVTKYFVVVAVLENQIVVRPVRQLDGKTWTLAGETAGVKLDRFGRMKGFGRSLVDRWDGWQTSKRFRRNMDEDLRALDRAWRANKNDASALQRLNAARQRAGLQQIGEPAFPLQWGYQAGVPDVETTAWGRRSILERYRDNISIGTHYIATHGDPKAVEDLTAILSGGLLASAEEEVRRLVRAGLMDRSESKEFFLADSHGIVILGNAYDYLRLVAFVVPAIDAAGDPFERPTLKCEVCQKTQVDFGDALCERCHLRICDKCSAGINCDNCNIATCVKCKSRLTCNAANCKNILCNSTECSENLVKCEMCPEGEANSLCEKCGEENKMCFECSEATCSVCHKALFTDEGNNRTKSCPDCDQLMHYACRKEPCKCQQDEEEDEEENEDDEENEHDEY